LDQALNVILKGGTYDEAMANFHENWATGWINKTKINLMTSTKIVYAAKDFEPDVFSEADWNHCLAQAKELGLTSYIQGNAEAIYDQVATFKKQVPHRTFTEAEFKYLNFCNWLSLKNKAPYFIKAYQTIVMPRIRRVIDVQREIKLEAESGDTVTGFIDLIAEMDDGNVYICDNKTAARPYEEDAVYWSPQLALYGFSEDIHHGAFIVLNKNLKKDTVKKCSVCGFDGSGSRAKTCTDESRGKRCGGAWLETTTLRADIQMLLGKLPAVTQQLVLDNFADVNKGIKQGFFPKNLHSCDDHFGGSCPFKGVCWANSMEGMEIV
jgi:hypothetical protein